MGEVDVTTTARNVRRTVDEALVWGALASVVDADKARARAAALEAMEAVGSLKQEVVDESDGTVYGTVSRAGGEWVAEVEDEDALLRWVEANFPAHVMSAVRPSYVEVLKKLAVADGVDGGPGRPVTTIDGEEVVVPGIQARRKPPGLRVLPNKAAYARLRRVLRELLPVRREIEEGETSE